MSPNEVDPLAEAGWRYLWQHANVAVLELSPAGVIRRANAYAAALSGLALTGCLLSEWLVFAPTGGPASWLRPTTDTAQLVNIKTAAGLPQTLYVTVWPLADGWLWFGQVDSAEQERLRQEFLILNHELSQLSRELSLKNVELARLNALKNQFLGMAAHDLRKPVNLVMTYTEFLQDDAASLTPDQQRFLASINRAAGRMARLIDDFLDVSLIEAGNLLLELELLDIPQLFDEIRDYVEIIAARRQITLVIDLEPELPHWLADVPKLEQVLLNLLSNAIEYSPPGSQVNTGCRRQGLDLLFWVTDQGPGLDEAHQKELFQAFNGTLRRKPSGERSFGLGLLIASKLVTAHGGQLAVDSTPGHGATFKFTLPPSAARLGEKQ